MSLALRIAFLTLFSALALAACGRTVQEDAPESLATAVEEQQSPEDAQIGIEEEQGEFAPLVGLMRTFHRAEGQADLQAAVEQARADGYSDEDIASALGLASLWTPPKRVLMSVVFVRFKNESQTSADVLDTAFEYANTPPRLRHPDDDEPVAAADDDSDDEEDAGEEAPRRRRGWFSWIPGL